MKELTGSQILTQLQKRVSVNSAKMLFQTAKVQSGIQLEDDAVLDLDQAKTLCLKLINQGGPSFQVGQAIYKEYLQ